jgi:hypothetical protein
MAVNSFLKIFEFWRFGVHELAVCTRWPKLLKKSKIIEARC